MSTATEAATMPIADGRRVLALIRAEMRGRWPLTALVVAVLAAAAALGLATPWGLGRIVDIATTGDGDHAGVWRVAAIMAVAALVGAALTAVGAALTGKLLETMLADIRERMMTAALRLPLGRVEAAGSGDLVSRATDDVGVVSTAIAKAIPAASAAGFAVLLTAVGLGALDLRFLAVVLVTLPVHALAVRMYLRIAPPVYAAERAAMASRAHHVLGGIRGLESVYAFGLSTRLGARIAEHSWAVVGWSMRARVVQNRFWGRLNLAEFLGMAAILTVGYLLTRDAAAGVGATTTAMLLFLRLFGPIGTLLLTVHPLLAPAASLGRIVGVIDAADETAPAPAAPARTTGIVAAAGLGFGYRAGHPVLHEVSFTVAPGEHVAVVGGSGAGKTTLVSLIAGVHRPDSGTLHVGARRTALLTQDAHVFAGPLAADLRMAAPDAGDAAIADALRVVGADGWVRLLPDGVDTVVGAHGHELTPVQERQIALARLHLMDPDLVILDEATAEAGSAGAELLEQAAEAALAGRSAVIVAHRLSQAAAADRVVVLDRGRVVEDGTHDELVDRGGRYARLWEAWSRYRVPHR